MLQRDVAVKVMHPHFARQAEFQNRFLQEGRTAARLNHRGIVQVFDSGFEGAYSLLYIVMEYIAGGNLYEMLKGYRKQGQWIVLGEAILVCATEKNTSDDIKHYVDVVKYYLR